MIMGDFLTMLAEILEPIKTRQSILTPGQLVDLSEVAIQRLSGKVRLIAAEQATVNPEPQWQHDFCSACGDFNHWRGCCPLSTDDCLLSRVLDCEGDIEALKGLSIGQGVKTDDVIQLWVESGEMIEHLFKKPVWLFCVAEHLTKGKQNVRTK